MSDAAPIRPSTGNGVALTELVRVARVPDPGSDVRVTGVSLASDRVRAGDLFAALPGARTHGAEFAAAAVDAGAVAVLTDAAGAGRVPPGVPVLVSADPRRDAAGLAAEIYGRPDRRLQAIAVTGTSGKTTTTTLIRAGLAAAGYRTGLIGTLGTFVGDAANEEELTTGLTTPEAPDLYALLAVLVERGASHVVMEVSSHALTQERVGDMRFAAAAFTNLSQDHLDFHADMEDYFAAKARLFDGRAARQAIVVDDDWGRRLAAENGRSGTVTVSTLSAGQGDWWAQDVRTDAQGGNHFTAVGREGRIGMSCRIPGAYNVANALLALAVLHQVGVPLDDAVRGIADAQVPGRMERIEAGQDFAAVVDYAHKPAAVAGALRALRPLTSGRLIVVLGCGGDRDRGKRPLMGEAAARGADVLIATDDNPRSEDPAAIREAMLAGALSVPAGERAAIEQISPRGDAIDAAVALARAGDTVLIAGKGHEPGQEIRGVKHPFDDGVELRRALSGRRAAAP